MRKLAQVLIGTLGAVLASVSGTGSVLGATAQSAPVAVDCHAAFDAYTVAPATLSACGLHSYARTQARSLPDGGQQSEYNLDGHLMVVRIPPRGFNPLKADGKRLDFYGFPPRPTTPDALAQWTSAMSIAHPVQPPAYQVMSTTTAGASAVWSGWRATSTSSSAYTFAEAVYNEPQALSTPCSGNAEVTWGGLGGWSSGYLAQGGTGINTPTLGQHQAWWEVLPDKPSLVPISGLYGHAGYGFAAFASWHGGYYSFFLEDYFTGAYSSFNYSTGSFDGSSADFIAERPQHNGTPYALTNYSYITFRDAWVNGVNASNGVGNYPRDNVSMWTYSNGTGDELAYNDAPTNSGQSFVNHYVYCQ